MPLPAGGRATHKLIPVIFTHLSSLYGGVRVNCMVRDGQNRRRHMSQMRAENSRYILRRGLRPAARRPLRSVRPQRFLHERQTRASSHNVNFPFSLLASELRSILDDLLLTKTRNRWVRYYVQNNFGCQHANDQASQECR